MATKKYVSLSQLSSFLENLKNLFVSRTEFDEATKSQVQIITWEEND